MTVVFHRVFMYGFVANCVVFGYRIIKMRLSADKKMKYPVMLMLISFLMHTMSTA